jgi:hypothetical protein
MTDNQAYFKWMQEICGQMITQLCLDFFLRRETWNTLLREILLSKIE